MPIYEYLCRACDHEFEFFHRSVGATEHPACPSCGGRSIQRKLSVFAAQQGGAEPACPGPSIGACAQCGNADGPCGL